MITAERARELLVYEPETGAFTWRAGKRKGSAKTVAGSINDSGGGRLYTRIRVDGHRCFAHRLAWLWMTGSWPTDIDHRDGNSLNNRWENLREANDTLNLANARRRKNNASGFRGVSFWKPGNKWRARIQKNGQVTWLGYYPTKEEAHAAYRQAAAEVFGEFARP